MYREKRETEQRRRLLMATDNRLDFPLDRIAKERDEIKAEDYYIRRGTTLHGIINENIFDNNFTLSAAAAAACLPIYQLATKRRFFSLYISLYSMLIVSSGRKERR